MARAKARRPRGGRPAPLAAPGFGNTGAALLRPEVVGTGLVVLAVAAIPYLVPVAGVFGEARSSLVEVLGLQVFSLILVLGGLGALLAARRLDLLRYYARQIAGAVAAVVFFGGLLGQWHPSTTVGDVALEVVSAGGSVGRWWTSALWPTVGWCALGAAAFALLWPSIAWRLARSTPPTLWALSRWLWSLRLERRLWHLLRSLTVRRSEVAEVAAPAAAEPVRPALTVVPKSAPASAVDEPAPKKRPASQLPMDIETPVTEWRQSGDGWQLPPLKMLKAAPPNTKGSVDNERRARLIEETLASFGVDASVVEVNEGPAVTQFGVEPGWDTRTKAVQERDGAGRPVYEPDGSPRVSEIEVSRTRIRVNRITALQNDLALALAAPALRIEAPVPGKAMVGIEVPNGSTSVVSMRSVMESPAFQKFAQKAALPVALGAGVSGEPVFADLAKMPHLLIAGATGSGKSVCLNSIITGLLMNYSPEQLRFVMVDPKRVELTAFGRVPHLAFSEIVVEMDRVVGTLQAVINEMDRRYRLFAQLGVRNIERFNEKEARKLPYWVVVIDELADLMLAVPYQVEHQLVRLAQLARATGIHLIVATQRPSVDVITGLIKANFPTRIAFAVSSMVDSRTILDQGGAEKLLGKGDMLYVPPEAQKPKRVQGVYVADDEIESVVAFWTQDRFKPLVPEKYDAALEQALEEASTLGAESEGGGGSDEMLSKAIDVARDSRTLSTSMLQRRLGIGYPRAARLMDLLEERGVVGPPEPGGKPRDVLLNADGDPSGGADTDRPASLAAHAAAVTLGRPTPAAPTAPPRPFDAD